MAIAILVVTFYVVRMVANIIKGLLENTQVNQLPAKVGLQDTMGNQKISDLVGHAIIFFAMLFAAIAAADLLGFVAISGIITMFIAFGANIILGAIVLFIGFWLANVIAGVVERSEQGSQFLANIVRVLIMGLVLAMGLKAMGIADSIVNLAFGLTLGAVAVAFALSFGLGGQEAAARFLRKMQDKMDRETDEAKAKSTLQQSKSTQEKFADSVRENTPSASTTSTSTNVHTDIVDTTHVNTDDIANDNIGTNGFGNSSLDNTDIGTNNTINNDIVGDDHLLPNNGVNDDLNNK